MRIVWLLVALLLPSIAAARDTWTDPHPGIRRLLRVTDAPLRIHVVKVDLTRGTIRVRASKTADRNITVSTFAERYSCHAAVNGDFFNLDNRQPTGLAIGGGEQWPGTRDTNSSGFIAVGRDNRAEISAPSAVVQPAEWMSEVVSGRPLIVNNGRVPEINCASHYCERHPRTAVGLDQAGETLIMAVVDGRSNASRGMTVAELGALMREMGAHRALNLDGGGSSAMYVRAAGGIVNRPSDGSERRVANHLGACVVAARGTLTGYVRAGDIYEGRNLAGAQVRLSTGAMGRAGDDGRYRFADVPRGDVEITASAPGFLAASRTVFVAAGDTTWGSIALQVAPEEPPPPPPVDAALPPPDADPPDAADAMVADAAAVDDAAVVGEPDAEGPVPVEADAETWPEADAEVAADAAGGPWVPVLSDAAAPGADGGFERAGGGAALNGGCRVGGGPSGWPALLLLALLGGLRRRLPRPGVRH